jgi:hypothetical protein
MVAKAYGHQRRTIDPSEVASTLAGQDQKRKGVEGGRKKLKIAKKRDFLL